MCKNRKLLSCDLIVEYICFVVVFILSLYTKNVERQLQNRPGFFDAPRRATAMFSCFIIAVCILQLFALIDEHAIFCNKVWMAASMLRVSAWFTHAKGRSIYLDLPSLLTCQVNK